MIDDNDMREKFETWATTGTRKGLRMDRLLSLPSEYQDNLVAAWWEAFQAGAASAQSEQKPVEIPPALREWHEAEQARLDTVAAYNASYDAVPSPFREYSTEDYNDAYEAMGDAKNKAHRLIPVMHEAMKSMLATTVLQGEQCPSEWISVNERLPDVGQVVMVFTPKDGRLRDEDSIDFDCIDPNNDDHASWMGHNEHYEHYCCIAKPEGSIGPSSKAPYAHWMPLPLPPKATT